MKHSSHYKPGGNLYGIPNEVHLSGKNYTLILSKGDLRTACSFGTVAVDVGREWCPAAVMLGITIICEHNARDRGQSPCRRFIAVLKHLKIFSNYPTIIEWDVLESRFQCCIPHMVQSCHIHSTSASHLELKIFQMHGTKDQGMNDYGAEIYLAVWMIVFIFQVLDKLRRGCMARKRHDRKTLRSEEINQCYADLFRGKFR